MLSHISPLLFYFLVIVTALDNKSSNESLVTRDETVNTLSKLWDFTGCTDGQKQAIKDGLSEANKILLSSGTSDMENHWGSYAFVEFFGPPVSMMRFRQRIETNYRNAMNFVDHWWSGNEVQIFCGEQPGKGSCSKYPGFIKVEKEGGTDNKLAMIFCDIWFSLGTLDAVFSSASTGPEKYDLFKYHNRALHWVGAMIQMPTINPWNVNNIRYNIIDFPTANPELKHRNFVHGVERTKYLGKLYEGTLQRALLISNINTWSWYAIAAYVQDNLGEYPYKPQVPYTLPEMKTGYVLPANEIANGALPEDPMLVAFEESLG